MFANDLRILRKQIPTDTSVEIHEAVVKVELHQGIKEMFNTVDVGNFARNNLFGLFSVIVINWPYTVVTSTE